MVFQIRCFKFGLNFFRSCQDSSRMHMDAGLYTSMADPLMSVGKFFSGPVSETHWNRDEEAVVMDMGCGPGNVLRRLILPLFPNLKTLYAVDLLQNMIDYAQANHPHPKVEYRVGDIAKWSSVSQWDGQISNFFSVHVFHWLKDQKQSFTNVHRLLKPGGQAVLFFTLQSTFFSTCMELWNDRRWSQYLKEVDARIPLSHIENYEPEHYADMLSEIGFRIEYCRAEVKEDAFPSDNVYKDFYSSFCVLLHHIPTELREEFKTDLFDILMKKNGRVKGLPVHRGRMIELIIQRI